MPQAVFDKCYFDQVALDEPGVTTQTILPSSIPSAEALGTPTIEAAHVIFPSSIASLEAFGNPTVIGLWVIVPSSIASAEAFGSLNIVYAQVIVAASIASAEAFGTARVGRALQHHILEGWYGQRAKGVNRAQVFGDDVFTEDWDWDELALVFDQLAQAHDLNLDSVAKAHARGGAMLRAAEVHAKAGYILVPLNCGQELYDVVQITDSRAGLIGAKRRVLALQHTYHPEKGTYALKLTIGAV